MSKPTRKQELIRKEFPKVRQYTKRGYTYYAVDLRRAFWKGQPFKNFSNRADALKYANELGESVQTNGVASVAKNLATLQYAPTLNDEWMDLPVTGPLPLSTIGKQGYFRVRVE